MSKPQVEGPRGIHAVLVQQRTSLQQLRLGAAVDPGAQGNHIEAYIQQSSTTHLRIIQPTNILTHLEENLAIKVQHFS